MKKIALLTAFATAAVFALSPPAAARGFASHFGNFSGITSHPSPIRTGPMRTGPDGGGHLYVPTDHHGNRHGHIQTRGPSCQGPWIYKRVCLQPHSNGCSKYGCNLWCSQWGYRFVCAH
jgi:hypothetical protein